MAQTDDDLQQADDDGMAQPVQSDRPTGANALQEKYDQGVHAGYSQALADLKTMVENQQRMHDGSLPRVNL